MITVNFDDGRLRAYPAERLAGDEYDRMQAVKFRWDWREQCFVAHWSPQGEIAQAMRFDELVTTCKSRKAYGKLLERYTELMDRYYPNIEEDARKGKGK